MSSVTNAVLAYGLCYNEDDHCLLAEINAACDAGRLVHVEDAGLPGCWFCNGKTLEVNLAVGAFNGLPLRDWIDAMRRIDFESYHCGFVQLMIQDQESTGFGIVNVWTGDDYDPFDGSMFAG